MADSTDPTTGDKGTSNTRFALVASFDAAGSLQITGPGLSDNTLIVEAGTQISVTISDPPDNHIYGEQIVGAVDQSASARARCLKSDAQYRVVLVG